MLKKFIDKPTARALLAEYGTPVYVYSEEILRRQANKIAGFLEGSGLHYSCHYAVKANSNVELLRVIREEGLKVDSMSPGELALAQKAGFTKNETLYVCNNVTADEMKLVAEQGIRLVLDSVSQVETFGRTCPGKEILVRINPGAQGVGYSEQVVTAGDKTKFGVAQEFFDELKSVAAKYNLKIIGVHQHLGSLFLDNELDQYIAGVEAFLGLAKEFDSLQIVDLGGGFGISYDGNGQPLNLELVKERLVPLLKNFVAEYGEVEFKFEPGRIVVAEAGALVGTVTALKVNAGINYIGTDIGMGILERPSRYDSYHFIDILANSNDETTATIVGNVCESCDVLGRDRKVKRPEVGDPVVVYDAGAYGYSMSSNYTGRERPAEVLITKAGQPKIIRKRQTVAELIDF